MERTKYRAIFKPDAETKDGILLFKSRRIGGRIWMVMVGEPDVRYELRVIRQDKDWVIWKRP